MTLHVTIDREKCCGYGICAEMCPQVYKLDDQGFVYLAADVVPADAEDDALEAAEACPEQVIALVRR